MPLLGLSQRCRWKAEIAVFFDELQSGLCRVVWLASIHQLDARRLYPLVVNVHRRALSVAGAAEGAIP
jgi:hypothetical protein